MNNYDMVMGSRYPNYQQKNIKDIDDYQSLSPIKEKGNARYLIGGTLFGLGLL
jgi:hypothetical protein